MRGREDSDLFELRLRESRPPTDTGFHRRLVEKSFRSWHSEQLQNGSTPGRDACNRHVLRITAECRDVVVNPLQRGELIHRVKATQRLVWLRRLGQCGMGEAALSQITIVKVDEHDSVARECRAVPIRHVGGTTRPVEINHHRSVVAFSGVHTFKLRQSSRPLAIRGALIHMPAGNTLRA